MNCAKLFPSFASSGKGTGGKIVVHPLGLEERTAILMLIGAKSHLMMLTISNNNWTM